MRVEENQKMCEAAGKFRTNDPGTAVLVMVLADISKSLAVIADNATYLSIDVEGRIRSTDKGE